jgi:hypothetical protein
MSPDSWTIVVRKSNCGRWVVDHDSEHILEEEGGYQALELQVTTIRSLGPADETTEENRKAS